MLGTKQQKRTIERESGSIPVVVTGRKSIFTFWKENSEIYSVSRLGAGFNLQRECSPGRLLLLMLDMPKTHRCYDWDKKLYQVWAVVQYCNPITQDDFEGFRIGVAFVGKNAPQSYISNSMKGYKISGMDENGFWSIGEAKAPFVSRTHPRFDCSLGTRIAVVDSEGEETEIENDVLTKNIGAGGAAVYSSLGVQIGDCVKFTCEKYDFSSLAIVRNRQMKEGDPITLHLSFSEAKFPVEELPLLV